MFRSASVTELKTDQPHVHAFRISGEIDDDTSEDLAKHMNAVFDAAPGKVNMLIDLTHFEGSDWTAIFDDDVVSSRVRALSSVEKYAVVGAPESAEKMIEFMNAIIPVDAKTFDATDIAAAWAFVGANEVSQAA